MVKKRTKAMRAILKSSAVVVVLALMVAALIFIGAGEAGHGPLLAIVAAPAATAELVELVNSQYAAIKAHHEKTDNNLGGIEARLKELEQLGVRRQQPASAERPSLGAV